jgi:hypothetical protein
VGFLIGIGKQDDDVVGVGGRETRPRTRDIEIAAVETDAPSAHRDAVAQRVGRGLLLELVEETDCLTGGIADAARIGAALIEFL